MEGFILKVHSEGLKGMFTGIVKEIGQVKRVRRGPTGRLYILAPRVARQSQVGDSIAVDGVCLTAVETERDSLVADIGAETLRRTTLGQMRPGNKVNLELSLKTSDRLSGHLVSGHVDGVGTVVGLKKQGDSIQFKIKLPSHLATHLVERGSIAVDGVSLTIASVEEDKFTVSLIPHTASVTTLGQKRVGSKVNVETDLVAKYVQKYLRRKDYDLER